MDDVAASFVGNRPAYSNIAANYCWNWWSDLVRFGCSLDAERHWELANTEQVDGSVLETVPLPGCE